MENTPSNGATTISASELFGDEQSAKSASEAVNSDETTETSEAQNAKPNADEEKKAPKKEQADEDSESDSDDEDSSEENEEAEDGENGEGKPKKKVSGFAKRLKRFQRQLSEKEQRIALLERELQAKGNPKGEDDPGKQQTSEKPKADDFESHEEFVEALTDWKLEQKEKDSERKSKEAQIKSEFQVKQKAHNERVQEFKKSQSDYEDTIADFLEEYGDKGDFIFSPGLTESIYDSEMGPKLIYELMQNPEELIRINKLGPVAAAKEIGKLEAKLGEKTPAPQKKAKTTTKAPPPPTPVGSKSEGKKSVYDENVSAMDFIKLRDEEEKRMRNNFF